MKNETYILIIYLVIQFYANMHGIQPPGGFTTPAVVKVGDEFTVKFTTINIGEVTLLEVTPTLTITGNGSVELVEGPNPESIPVLNPGGIGNFTWIFQATSAGKLRFHCVVTGIRADTSEKITSAEAISDYTTIQGEMEIRADPDGPYQGYEGEIINITAEKSESSNGPIIMYEWDLNGDGSYEYKTEQPQKTEKYDKATSTHRLS